MGNRQNSIKISMKKSNMPYRKAYIPSRRSTYIVDSGGEILVAGRLATLLFLKEVMKISINSVCLTCCYFDCELGCSLSSDLSYFCPLEPEPDFEGVTFPDNPDYTGDK